MILIKFVGDRDSPLPCYFSSLLPENPYKSLPVTIRLRFCKNAGMQSGFSNVCLYILELLVYCKSTFLIIDIPFSPLLICLGFTIQFQSCMLMIRDRALRLVFLVIIISVLLFSLSNVSFAITCIDACRWCGLAYQDQTLLGWTLFRRHARAGCRKIWQDSASPTLNYHFGIPRIDYLVTCMLKKL